MVGTRTSTGCHNCLKRKKKCGKQLPSCLECLRAGWPCPGYTTRWKFVDETGRVRASYAKRLYIYEYVDRFESEPISNGVEETFHSVVKLRSRQKLNIRSWQYENDTHFIPPIPRSLDIDPRGSAFVFCLGHSADKSLVPLSSFGSFFDFIPARLGVNAALDDAALCICSIYGGALVVPHANPGSIFKQYSKALSSLRGHISNPKLNMLPETLCATILLQLCELAVSHVDNGEWSNLARGTAVLIRSRGVDRYDSDFEFAMLEAQLPFILGQSMRFNEPCFAAKQEWQSLITGPARQHQKTQSRSLSLRTQLCSILFHLPSLIIDLRAFNITNDSTIDEILQRNSRLLELARRTTALRDAVEEWLTIRAEPMLSVGKADSTDATYIEPFDAPFDEQTTYQDLLSGVLECVSHNALIIIDKISYDLYQLIKESSTIDPDCLLLQELKFFSFFGHQQKTQRHDQRIQSSFQFVQNENATAAKPLINGLGHFGLSIGH